MMKNVTYPIRRAVNQNRTQVRTLYPTWNLLVRFVIYLLNFSFKPIEATGAEKATKAPKDTPSSSTTTAATPISPEAANGQNTNSTKTATTTTARPTNGSSSASGSYPSAPNAAPNAAQNGTPTQHVPSTLPNGIPPHAAFHFYDPNQSVVPVPEPVKVPPPPGGWIAPQQDLYRHHMEWVFAEWIHNIRKFLDWTNISCHFNRGRMYEEQLGSAYQQPQGYPGSYNIHSLSIEINCFVSIVFLFSFN